MYLYCNVKYRLQKKSVHMNTLHGIHMHKNTSEDVCCLNGGNVRKEHIPHGCNYSIADNNLRLPLRVPQFSSEGQTRGITTNYRLSVSPATWYFKWPQSPTLSDDVIYCMFIQRSKVKPQLNSLSLAFK